MLEEAAPRRAVAKRTWLPALTTAGLQQLTAVLLAAVLAETLLLRGVTRIGVHIPKGEGVSGAFQAASFLGSLAFNFASLLVIVLVVVILGSMLRRMEGGLSRLVLVGLSGAMLIGLGLSLTTDAPAADALFGVAVALLVGFITIVTISERRIGAPATLALILIAAAYLSYQYYVLGYLFYRILDYTAVPPMSTTVLRLGEALAVVAAAAAFWAWGLPRWRWVGNAGLAAVAAVLLTLIIAGLSPASTMAILALWTTGLSLVLPFPVYLIALALYLLTLVACWRSGDAFWTAAGLLLVLLAGYMAESTYHHLLVLLGVAFLGGIVQQSRATSGHHNGSTEALPSRLP